MSFKYRFKEALRFIAFAFYPKAILVACTAFFFVVISVLVSVMVSIPKDSNWYNIVFALTTGAAGSFFVAIIVELAGNYRHNKLAWYELQDYYSVVMDHEVCKQVKMQLTPLQRAEKKAHEEFVADGGVDDYVEEPKDIIQITWEELPTIIPVLKQTLEEKKEYLSDEEIEELRSILLNYTQIQFEIKERVIMLPMEYDALNHPDVDLLNSLYPSNILRNMPTWIQNRLARKESQQACNLFANAILTDGFILSRFMKDYDISQRGIDNYQDELKTPKEADFEPEDIDYDDLDFSQPDDEEVFRAQCEESNRQMELRQKPFVSWHISMCCQDIAESLNKLEKSIQKKPTFGMMIKCAKSFEKEPINDGLTRMIYESTKRQLNKRLAKQKAAKKQG